MSAALGPSAPPPPPPTGGGGAISGGGTTDDAPSANNQVDETLEQIQEDQQANQLQSSIQEYEDSGSRVGKGRGAQLSSLSSSHPNLSLSSGRQPNPDLQKQDITNMVQDLFGSLPEGFDPNASISELSSAYRQVTGGSSDDSDIFGSEAKERLSASRDMGSPGLPPPVFVETGGNGDDAHEVGQKISDNKAGTWLEGADSYTALASLAYQLISDSQYDKTVLTNFMQENSDTMMQYSKDIAQKQIDAAHEGMDATRDKVFGSVIGSFASTAVSAVPVGVNTFSSKEMSMAGTQFTNAIGGLVNSTISGTGEIAGGKETEKQQITQAQVGVEQATVKVMEQAQQTSSQSFSSDTDMENALRQFLLQAIKAAQKGGQ